MRWEEGREKRRLAGGGHGRETVTCAFLVSRSPAKRPKAGTGYFCDATFCLLYQKQFFSYSQETVFIGGVVPKQEKNVTER